MTGAFWRVGHECRDRVGAKFDDDELPRWPNTGFGKIQNLSIRSAYGFTREHIRKIYRALRRELDKAKRRFS